MTNRRAGKRMSLVESIYGGLLREEISWGSKYEEFVKTLGANATDPKTQAFISAGQLDKDPDDDKFNFSSESISVTDLRPTQNEVDVEKSLAYPMKKPEDFLKYVKGAGVTFAPGGPIVTYNGSYVIDGHHRWSQLYACNSETKIQAIDIQISGLDPLDVLKAVQSSIALQKGDVPVQSVKGINLLDIGKAELLSWLDSRLSSGFYDVVEADPEAMKVIKSRTSGGSIEDTVAEYIWSNVSEMQSKSQPVPGAPKRDFMPQTDNVDWQTPLAQGLVDIAKPHATGVAEAARRWQRMAGILKG